MHAGVISGVRPFQIVWSSDNVALVHAHFGWMKTSSDFRPGVSITLEAAGALAATWALSPGVAS